MRSCNNKKNRNPYADFLFTGKIIKHTLFPIVANTYFFVTYWHLSSYYTITMHYNYYVACMCTSDKYLYLFNLEEAFQLLLQFHYH